MEREHLFRAKNISKQWVYGSLNVEFDGSARISYWYSKLVEPETNCYEPEHDLEDVNHETVGEYTSLKDCNVTRIFEGDLFHLVLSGGSVYAEVVFCKAMFCVRFRHPEVSDPYTYIPLHEFLQSSDRIIAGNVHDNPNLIKL